MGKKKKEPIELFPTFASVRNMDPPDEVVPEDVRPGEFRDTAVLFAPSQQRGECGLTLRFRCTAKISRGDTITIRLTGFKGVKGTVFALESRPHPENKMYNHHFMAYYSGSTSPKGVAPQAIILKCRSAIEENALVILGVPEAVHVVLPDKLAINSTKLKIEGAIRHAENGKIPKAPVMECTEVRKRPVQDDIAELEDMLGEFIGTEEEPGVLRENDLDIVQEITTPEADVILEAVHDRRTLPIGMTWSVETSVFQSYETSCQSIAQALREAYREECRIPMAVHREIARNYGIKLSAVIVLEDALYTMHGAYYPELTRSAVMVLRLYTMEAHDLSHLLEVFHPPCMHREIHSGMRSKNPTLLKKWVNCIAVLSTCTSKLTHIAPEMIPVLYAGVRDLPPDMIHHLQGLQKGDWYVTNNFLSCTANVNIADENFSPPDNAVIFEIRRVIDAVEIGDCSQYPEDRQWLLPMMTSYAVVAVEVLPDKNNLTKVTLNMRGSLGSALRDEHFPEQERTETSTAFFKRAKAVSEPIALRTAAIAKCIYANLRLQERKQQHPQHLPHARYLAQYAETQRQSRARQSLEEGLCKWLVCTAEEQVSPDGVTKPAVWEVLQRKYSQPLEACFLKRTRTLKQFQVETLNIDFAACTVDYGKGPQRIRRVVGKVDSYPFQPM